MEYTTLGDTGMEVSRICLGCMSFGDEWSWTLDEGERTEIIERAIERLREYAEGDRPFYHALPTQKREPATALKVVGPRSSERVKQGHEIDLAHRAFDNRFDSVAVLAPIVRFGQSKHEWDGGSLVVRGVLRDLSVAPHHRAVIAGEDGRRFGERVDVRRPDPVLP